MSVKDEIARIIGQFHLDMEKWEKSTQGVMPLSTEAADKILAIKVECDEVGDIFYFDWSGGKHATLSDLTGEATP